MPLPDPSAACNFIDHYLKIRYQTHNSSSGKIKRLGETACSFLTSSASALFSTFASPSEEKETVPPIGPQEICLRLKQKFLMVKEIEGQEEKVRHWVKILFLLRKEAQEAFNRSWLGSLLCETLHAICTYIINALKDEEIFQSALLNYKNRLDPYIPFDACGPMRLKDISIKDLDQEHQNILCNLADMGEKEAIIACIGLDSYKKLPLPSEEKTEYCLQNNGEVKAIPLDKEIPFCYQKEYFFIYYNQHSSTIKMTFEQFIGLQSIPKEEDEFVHVQILPKPALLSDFFSPNKQNQQNTISINNASGSLTNQSGQGPSLNMSTQ